MRLIDADAMDEDMDKLMKKYTRMGRKKMVEDYNFVRTVLSVMPTVDAVKVVRCEKCNHRGIKNEGLLYCHHDKRWHSPSDFCSYGERKDGKECLK